MQIEKGKQIKILAVDDNASSLKLLEIILRDLGHDVITATNGRDCLQLAKKELPDLIFLDVMLPEISGGKTAELLSEDERTKNIPIIFQTVLITEEEEAKNVDSIGKHMYIAKPLNKSKVADAIIKTLNLA